MPAQIEPRSGLNYGWALGEDNWNDGMDNNMLWLGRFGTHLSAKSRTIGTPPGSPAVGDTYIIPAGATGDWAGQTNAVTIWDGTAWQFATPRRGWVANIEDGAGLNLYNGTDWATQVGGGAVASHVALADPHAQYVLESNILGTVTQSGGVPTGAIFEAGSNANGTYTKFADGTAIAIRPVTGVGPVNVAVGSLFATTSVASQTLPMTFASTPTFTASSFNPFVETAFVAFGSNGTVSTTPPFSLFRATAGVRVDHFVNIVAIGRWF